MHALAPRCFLHRFEPSLLLIELLLHLLRSLHLACLIAVVWPLGAGAAGMSRRIQLVDPRLHRGYSAFLLEDSLPPLIAATLCFGALRFQSLS